MTVQSAGQIWRGTVSRVLDDGLAWVIVPKLLGTAPVGPMPVHGNTEAGASVLVVLLGGTRQNMVAIPEVANASTESDLLSVDRTVGTRVALSDPAGSIALLSSTGVRDIRALWDGGMVGAPPYSTVWLYREGNSVTLMLNLAKDGGNIMKYALPSGFKPSTTTLISTSAFIRLDARSVLMQISSGNIYGVYDQEAPMDQNSDIVGQWTWHTSDPWPASLPGVPAVPMT